AATDREILLDAGKVTTEIAKAHAECEFEKYRIVQDRLFESDFDKVLKQIESAMADNQRKSLKSADDKKDVS
ncbi:MAG: cell filamentation protein Fic, partial [Deltaproteobacteria bacterium CG_4_8_14_3_um_filter_51_11]